MVADLIAGSWRTVPPVSAISRNSLESIRSILLRSAAAGLGWWKIRHGALRDTPAAADLREAFRLYSVSAALHAHHLEILVNHLRRQHIEPVLAKGWAVARLYPEPGMRPYGDFDICVPPARYGDAIAACSWTKRPFIDVDIHAAFRELEADYPRLLQRSVEVPIGATSIRVLGAEDHFRLLAIHMLYHGAWKPGWLCDVALLLETAGPAFDWDRCLSGDGKRAQWVRAAISLAHGILGARLPAGVSGVDPTCFPRWLFAGLRVQWGRSTHYMTGPSAAALFRQGRFLELLRGRWPNPLQATVRMGAAVNAIPRLPFQLADVLRRARKLAG